MISIVEGVGSSFDADVEALVNPVHCVGVMGKGLALVFKKRFPDVFRTYERACAEGTLVPGRVQVVATNGQGGPKAVINFPTKRHWRDKSRMEDIASGLVDLARELREHEIRSVAIPALGCGLGGLEWKDVRSAIATTLTEHLGDHDDRRVVLFEPR